MATVEAEPQHMTAMRKANRVRCAAAAIKRKVRDGEMSLAAAIEHPDAAPLTVLDLLTAALSEAYSMSERMSRVLAQARDEATSDEARKALDAATGHYHRMRDDIVRALGVS